MKSTKEETERKGGFNRQQRALINTYITSFIGIYERKPLKEEITSNMEDTVDNSILTEFLDINLSLIKWLEYAIKKNPLLIFNIKKPKILKMDFFLNKFCIASRKITAIGSSILAGRLL